MKYLGNNIFVRTFLSLLAVGVMAFGVLTIVSMNHNMGMNSTCPTLTEAADCSGAHGSQVCVNYHLGIMQNLSAACQSDFGIRLIYLLSASLVFLLSLILLEIFESDYIQKRQKFRQLFKKAIMAFSRQLGFWLTLLEKRDPSYALILA